MVATQNIASKWFCLLFGPLLLALLATLMGCAGKSQKTKPELVFKHYPISEELHDDADLRQLQLVLQKHIVYWSAKSRSKKSIRWGKQYSIEASKYVQILKQVDHLVGQNMSKALQYLQEEFVFLAVEESGKAAGEAFFTSYFEPVLEASHRRDGKFWQPIYEPPKDMVVVNMKSFAETFPRWSLWKDLQTEKKSPNAVLRGRLKEKEPRLSSLAEVVPYYDRKQIDELGLLNGNAKVIAYLSPVDSFFLQIQGSGVLQFENGHVLRVGYAAQNGHPYTAIGKFMFDAIPRSKMSMQAIEEYLERLSAQERQEYMNRNASYVFFQTLEGRGLTYMGTEVVDGRTIATDTSVYPKGTLAYIRVDGFNDPKTNQPLQRLVMDQDTGGAIRGAGRVDLFWGQGDEAKQIAGGIKNPGRLFYLFPKSALPQ